MEKILIRNSELGDTVKIGKVDWVIIASDESKALLMKKKALKKVTYNDNTGDVTWEKSTLRKWLNTEYLDNRFSIQERKQIILTNIVNENNSQYGTIGGNTTQDYLFVLSKGEAETYQKILTGLKYNSWLRSPGNSQNSVAFLSSYGTIMSYGYPANSDEMNVYPLMWFNVK